LEELQDNVQIVIIDNKSTYLPLLKYYKTIKDKYEVLMMKKNYGYTVIKDVLWLDESFKKKYRLMTDDYVYSDCDIIPDKDCPKNFLSTFKEILDKYKVDKVGFGLRIDNLPDHYKNKEAVIKWEQQFWRNKIDKYCRAPIDTTFALRKAGTCAGHSGNAIRTMAPYIAEHLPWYIDTNNLTDEDRFYHNSIKTSTHWSEKVITRQMKWKIYQIFYNDESKKRLSPIFEPYDNSADKSHEFFENSVIIDIYTKLDTIDAEYVGTCSWKVLDKIQIGSKEFVEALSKTNCNFDVVLFPIQRHMNQDCMQRNKVFYSPLYQLSELFDNENILPFKMTTDKWTCSYCNFWVAKKEVYKDYCERVLIPAMKAFRENEKIITFIKGHKSMHGGTPFPYTPFLLELLMGFYVNKFEVTHTIITPNKDLELKPDEVWCKVLNKSLVPEGTEYVKFKKDFAEGLQTAGHIKIMEKWR
jgi:hypothetical protein